MWLVSFPSALPSLLCSTTWAVKFHSWRRISKMGYWRCCPLSSCTNPSVIQACPRAWPISWLPLDSQPFPRPAMWAVLLLPSELLAALNLKVGNYTGSCQDSDAGNLKKGGGCLEFLDYARHLGERVAWFCSSLSFQHSFYMLLISTVSLLHTEWTLGQMGFRESMHWSKELMLQRWESQR